MFHHFIITRFNLRNSVLNATTSQPDSADDWMEQRIRIFEDYCYASVMHQKKQAFTWLVFFDVSTDSQYVKKLKKLSDNYTNFVPVYIDGMKSFLPSVKLEIKSRSVNSHIITSRLDNDDCIHQDYVSFVQSQFSFQHYLAVNFINGITLKINDEFKCGYRIHANNPFISLIEKNDGNIDTICSKHHGEWGKIRLVTQVFNETPLWLSVIHGSNILNRYIGFGNIKKSTLEGFNIAPSVLENVCNNMTENQILSSLKNKYAAYLHYYLKTTRHKIRDVLKLIPDK